MKAVYLLLTFIVLSPFINAQNNPPIAVNDTLYVNFNDSLSVVCIKTGNDIYPNDSDPDNDNIFIDTFNYFNQGAFYLSPFSNPSNGLFVFNFRPSLNFWGLDSVQYILKDDGNPVMYDTAWIFFQVKRQEYEFLDLNNIKAEIDLLGLFMDKSNSISSFNVPKQKNPSDPLLHTIFAANLWLAGKNQDSIYANCETFTTHFNSSNQPYPYYDSRSGPIMDSIHYLKEYDYQWDRLWKVSNLDIIYHQNNWSNTGYQPIEVIKSWPAHGDTSKGQAYYLAPFIDNNNDGVYNPYHGDYPKIKGQQAIYHIYNDVRTIPGSYSSMNTEVHCLAYAYNCPSDSALNNTVFVDYTIYNRSNLIYDSTYVGMWTDFDIGGSSDDLVASDVQRSTFYGYNGDNIDEGGNGVYGYQNYPPAQGVVFLKGAPQDNDGIDNPFTTNIQDAVDSNGIVYPYLGLGFGDGIIDNEYWGMEHAMYYSVAGGQFLGDGYPQNKKDYYNFLRGYWRDGTQMVWGGFGHTTSGGTIPTKHLFPRNSDPLWYGTKGVIATPSNWDEFSAGNSPGDRRMVGSSGPFTFEPDSSVEITLAFVFGRDYQNTGNMAGVTVMQERVDSIHSYYRNGFTTTACGTALSTEELGTETNPLNVYPNPFTGQLTIDYIIENPNAQLTVFDVYGKLVMEQKLNRYKTNINLQQESKGVYFIRIVDGEHVLTKKLIKQ